MNPAVTEPGFPTAFIAAQSERQAMDWSLVLASQEIGVSIERDAGTGRWKLVVADSDLAAARDAIHRFRLENRGWWWRRHVPGSELHFHGAALVWVFVICLLHSAADGTAIQRATFVTEAVRHGEWWRAFTATWLHADLGHLAMNAILGGLLLGLALGRYGGGLGSAAALLAGAAANWIAPSIRHHDYIGLGASGVVMAALGMLAAQMMAWWRQSWRATRLILAALMAGTWLFLALGTSPQGDVVVHALGFAFGVIFGGVLALLPERWSPRLNQAGWVVTFLAVVVPWALALRS